MNGQGGLVYTNSLVSVQPRVEGLEEEKTGKKSLLHQTKNCDFIV